MYTAKFPIENNARVSEDGGREGEKGESERDRQTKEVGETEKNRNRDRPKVKETHAALKLLLPSLLA